MNGPFLEGEITEDCHSLGSPFLESGKVAAGGEPTRVWHTDRIRLKESLNEAHIQID